MRRLPAGVTRRGERLVRAADGAVFERRRAKTGDYLINTTADPVGWYDRRGVLSEEQVDAARRLERDHAACVSPMARCRLAPVPVGAGTRTHAVERFDAYHRAMRAIPPALRPVVWVVCCEGRFAAAWARDARLPARDGIVRLRDGLDALAAHYAGRTRST